MKCRVNRIRSVFQFDFIPLFCLHIAFVNMKAGMENSAAGSPAMVAAVPGAVGEVNRKDAHHHHDHQHGDKNDRNLVIMCTMVCVHYLCYDRNCVDWSVLDAWFVKWRWLVLHRIQRTGHLVLLR